MATLSKSSNLKEMLENVLSEAQSSDSVTEEAMHEESMNERYQIQRM